MNGRVTIEDVARAAGVSRQTVSRVLNDRADVSTQTRQRILRIIEDLGYRPSRIARGLATDQTGTFGLVLPDVANPFFAEVVRGAEEVARPRGYSIFLCNTDENPQHELAALHSLQAQHVDGLILCSPRLTDRELAELIPRLPPVVLVNHRLKPGEDTSQELVTEGMDRPVETGVGAVLADDAFGISLAVHHLWQRRHRQIGLLGGPPTSHSGHRRRLGFKATMAELGGRADDQFVQPCLPTVAGGREATLALLAEHPQITALLCYNDLVAVGALQACRHLDRKVPDNLAITGFDDIALAALVEPPLTTLQVPARQLGQEAMSLLLGRLSRPDEPLNPIVLQPKLIVRGSAP